MRKMYEGVIMLNEEVVEDRPASASKRLVLKVRRIFILGIVALGVLSSFACDAITKKGVKCKRAPLPGSQYCWQHGGRQTNTNMVAVAATNAQVRAKNDDNAKRVQCDAKTKKGDRCKRKALPGGTKCWQHQ